MHAQYAGISLSLSLSLSKCHNLFIPVAGIYRFVAEGNWRNFLHLIFGSTILRVLQQLHSSKFRVYYLFSQCFDYLLRCAPKVEPW